MLGGAKQECKRSKAVAKGLWQRLTGWLEGVGNA